MKTAAALFTLLITLPALALDPPFIVESDGRSMSSLSQIASEIEQGSVVILGELHDNIDHHDNQLRIVQALIDLGHDVNLGMEFLNYTDQFEIYKYSSGLITKEEFLKSIDWKNLNTFEFYSPMIDAVNANQGSVLSLNIPRLITSKVSRSGIDSLTKPEQALLPYPLQIGSDFYYERFYKAVGGEHVPDDKVENYFWAQSIWDDVMTWKALESIDKNPSSVLVVIVGDFHVSYGGGLKDLFNRKGFFKVKTLSQTIKGDSSDQELRSNLTPHPKYGARADWIWVTK